MANATIAYHTNAKVWARRLGVEYAHERAEKAWAIMEAAGLSESQASLGYGALLKAKELGHKGHEAFMVGYVVSRTLLEVTRGDFLSGTDSVGIFIHWTEKVGLTQQFLDKGWIPFIVREQVRKNISDMVADAIAVRNREKAQPSIANQIIATARGR